MKHPHIALRADHCLRDKAGMLRVVGDHAFAKEEVVFGRVGEQFFGTSRGQSLVRQSQCIANGCAEQASDEGLPIHVQMISNAHPKEQ